jgi:hypothetical protein
MLKKCFIAIIIYKDVTKTLQNQGNCWAFWGISGKAWDTKTQ